MSSSVPTDTSDTFEIVNVAETKEVQKTVDDHIPSSVAKMNTDSKVPQTVPDTTTSSEDPEVICEQSDTDMDTIKNSEVLCEKSDVDMVTVTNSEVFCEKSDVDMLTVTSENTALSKSNEVPASTKILDGEKEEVEDECIISVDSDTSDLLDTSESSVDEGIISEERKNNIIKTFETYVGKFDNWIEELDLSLGWVPDLEEVPATKWILDRLP